MEVPDSPAKMWAARDISDGTDATPKKDLTNADQPPFEAKQSPALKTPDDIALTADEKHLPMSTSVSSDGRTHFPDKATDGAPSYPDSPPSEVLVSSAIQLDSLHDPAGTRVSPEVTSHDAESTSSGKTSLIPTSANGISSTDGNHAHGSTSASPGDNSQPDVKSDDTSTSRSLKRKLATPIAGQPPKAQGMQQSSKRMKSRTNPSSLTATESAMISSGFAVSIPGPMTSTAANQGNASVTPTTSAHTQASTTTPAHSRLRQT